MTMLRQLNRISGAVGALAVALTIASSFASSFAIAAPAYVPGLGELMGAIQLRHAKLWFAGQAGNWPLAAYELDELNEGFDDVRTYQPHFKGMPIAKTLKVTIREPLEQLEAAVKAKDAARFEMAFDAVSQACSSCHREMGHGFIVIQRPTAPPLTNQRFAVDARP